jgi:hypothetical protein
MARKKKTITITEAGRDLGKNFLLTEMPVDRGEKWAARALLALAKSGAELPDGGDGMAALASFGLEGITKLAWEDVEPLLDEMMGCIKFIPAPGMERDLMLSADDIEELGTLLTLRKGILGLHFDFFATAVGSN